MDQIRGSGGVGLSFDSETTAIAGCAYEKAIIELRYGGGSEIVKEIIARRILLLAATGERDADRLSSTVLADLGIESLNH